MIVLHIVGNERDGSFTLSDHSLAHSFLSSRSHYRRIALSFQRFIYFIFLQSFLYVLARYIWQIVYIFVYRYFVYYISEQYIIYFNRAIICPRTFNVWFGFYPSFLIFFNSHCCKYSVSLALLNGGKSVWRNYLVPRPDFPLSIPH